MNSAMHLDKLALVSRLILDQRVIDLRRENEELKMKLFWKDYSVCDLEKVMRCGNIFAHSAPKCNCAECSWAERMDIRMVEDKHANCTFKPWFEMKIKECGMTVGYDCSGLIKNHESRLAGVYEADCHFVSVTGDWNCFSYGRKLWGAQTTADPELQKLRELFCILTKDEDISMEGGFYDVFS